MRLIVGPTIPVRRLNTRLPMLFVLSVEWKWKLFFDSMLVLQCRTNTIYQKIYILLYFVRIYHTETLYVL